MAMLSDQLMQCPPPRPMTMDRRWRANIEPAPNCPRCASPNTKFCYYNNYSLSQPRYFCKGCRRYWTKGGSLRTVPVGGGCRKSRRSRSRKNSGPCFSTNPSPYSSSSSSTHESNDPDIDMAAVFAKFLSDDDQINVNEEINEATTTPSEASHDSLTSNYQRLLDDVLDQQFQEFMTPDLASFDDIIDDVLWSDASNLSNLTWQPATQLEEFDSPLLPVDPSNTSTNLLSCDTWSCFI